MDGDGLAGDESDVVAARSARGSLLGGGGGVGGVGGGVGW